MRIFKNESIFNQETQDWEEYYSVNDAQVTADEFSEQVEIEELATKEDDEIQEQEEQECECSCDGDCENCDSEDRETDYSDCECDECRTQRHEDIVNESVGIAFDKIMEAESCPNCIIDALMEFSLEMKRLGWSDHKDYITECNC